MTGNSQLLTTAKVETLSARVQSRPEVISDGDGDGGAGGAAAAQADRTLLTTYYLLHSLHLHLLHLLHVQVDRSLLRQSALLLPAGIDRTAVLCAVLAARGGGAEPKPEAEAGAGLAVVFCETKRQCREVAERLQGRGAAALALHGDLEQMDRDR